MTIEFYKRNYIEGLFISSAVLVSPDYTGERILKCLEILRNNFGFCGYIHAKIIPGTSTELVQRIGMLADRLSVNIEIPTEEGLKRLAPQKKIESIVKPMRQITNKLIEQNSIEGGIRGSKQNNTITHSNRSLARVNAKERNFAPAGQTTQMIIGAANETDMQIIKTSEKLYERFMMKRVYFSAYIPLNISSYLPSLNEPPPLMREHRLYQADWLLRFYDFKADEIVNDANPNLDLEMDPKAAWAIRNIDKFPIEINKADLRELLRIPGVGEISARRIIRQRRLCNIGFEDLKRMGVVVKRAKYFITCRGKYYGGKDLIEEKIKGNLLLVERIQNQLAGYKDGKQISMFENPELYQIGREASKWPSISMMEALTDS